MSNKKNLENILKNLSRYSSGDNSQPFFFQIDELNLTIKIIHDADIAFHNLNPDNLISLVSFGMIIQMMAELSLLYSFQFDFNLAISEAEVNHKGRAHWGTFKISSFPDTVPETSVFIGIHSNRMFYKNKDINFPQIDEDIKISGKLKPEELKLLLTAESVIWKNSLTLNHIFNWAHLRKSTYQKEKSGFHSSELNMNWMEALLIPLFKSRFFAKVVIFFPIVKFISWRKAKSVLEHTPNIIGIYNKLNSSFDLIELGQKAFKIKFSLAKIGIVTQPLSLVTFPYISHKLNPLNNCDDTIFKSVQEMFKVKFQHDPKNKDVAWLFRAGYPEVILPSTLRKDLADIVIP